MARQGFSSGRESSLHSAIKRWYLLEGDSVEAKVDDFIVDIKREDLLVEIQIANFSALKQKLVRLLNGHRVRIVYPIPRVKWIVHKQSARDEVPKRRLSPKRGNLYDVFNELIRIPALFLKGNLSVEVLMIEMEEIWRNDGRGSWRRKGASIEDRKLIRVFETKLFRNRTDFLELLHENLPDPFSNSDLAKSLGIRVSQSRKMTYSLRKMGAIVHVGKRRKQMLFERA